jgi:hypothetical protein
MCLRRLGVLSLEKKHGATYIKFGALSPRRWQMEPPPGRVGGLESCGETAGSGYEHFFQP